MLWTLTPVMSRVVADAAEQTANVDSTAAIAALRVTLRMLLAPGTGTRVA